MIEERETRRQAQKGEVPLVGDEGRDRDFETTREPVAKASLALRLNLQNLGTPGGSVVSRSYRSNTSPARFLAVSSAWITRVTESGTAASSKSTANTTPSETIRCVDRFALRMTTSQSIAGSSPISSAISQTQLSRRQQCFVPWRKVDQQFRQRKAGNGIAREACRTTVSPENLFVQVETKGIIDQSPVNVDTNRAYVTNQCEMMTALELLIASHSAVRTEPA